MSQPDPPFPHLLLHGTFARPIFSLSQASPSSSPLTLHITARLVDSPSPITILLSHSVLSASHQNFYSSYFSLTSTTTGFTPRQMRVHGLLAPRVVIRDPDTQLVTLWPDKNEDTTTFTNDDTRPPDDGAKDDAEKLDPEDSNNGSMSNIATFSMPLGPIPSSRYAEREAEGKTTHSLLPYLAIAGTPLAGLVAGETYEIELRDINGLYPGYVWWWANGQMEEVVDAMLKRDGGEGRSGMAEDGAGRVFEVPVVDLGGDSGGQVRRMGVEMVEKPILSIVE